MIFVGALRHVGAHEECGQKWPSWCFVNQSDLEDLNRCPEVTDKGRRAWQKRVIQCRSIELSLS
jgi:hypothetical protein